MEGYTGNIKSTTLTRANLGNDSQNTLFRLVKSGKGDLLRSANWALQAGEKKMTRLPLPLFKSLNHAYDGRWARRSLDIPTKASNIRTKDWVLTHFTNKPQESKKGEEMAKKDMQENSRSRERNWEVGEPSSAKHNDINGNGDYERGIIGCFNRDCDGDGDAVSLTASCFSWVDRDFRSMGNFQQEDNTVVIGLRDTIS